MHPPSDNQFYPDPMESDGLQMASLRLPDNEDLDFDTKHRATPLAQYSSTEATYPRTRHHLRQHFNASVAEMMYRETANNFVDIISNSIIDMVNSNYSPESKLSTVHGVGFLNTARNTMTDFAVTRPTVIFNASVANVSNGGLSPEFYYYRHSSAMTAVYCVAYLLVFAVGLVGNCFVIAVVFRSPRMRTVTNFFIVNLAVADILVIVFCLPATLMSNIFVREYNFDYYILDKYVFFLNCLRS